jgi:hypothetical protein
MLQITLLKSGVNMIIFVIPLVIQDPRMTLTADGISVIGEALLRFNLYLKNILMDANWMAPYLNRYLCLLTIVLLFLSCEEKIDVNLKSDGSKVVVEGFITNSGNPIVVKLSRSQEFFNQSSFMPVEKASAEIESQSTSEQLVEEGAGYYVASRMAGIPGRSYTLRIGIGNETYRATADLPYPVAIDTVYFRYGSIQRDSLNAIVEFQDPGESENYYRIKLYHNRKYAVNDYFLLTDANMDGTKMVVQIYYRYFAPGDTLAVELLNLERNTWKYFKGLSEAIQQGVNSQAPGNPPTNISGDALGIFGAYSSSSWLGIVPLNSDKR